MQVDAYSPARKHSTDAGVDVYALEGYFIDPHCCAKVHTGITFEIGPGWMLLAKPKSGSDFLVGAGVIDPGYQGEIIIKVVNYSDDAIIIRQGDAVAQLVQVPILTDALEEVPFDEINQEATPRGADGGIVRQG
jgi:dUTP pyrophosphatase